MRTHLLTTYAETAVLADSSDDPRIAALRRRLAEPGAVVVAADYRAVSGAGRPRAVGGVG